MSDTSEVQEEWTETVERMNEAVAASLEENVQAQAALLETWTEAMEDAVPEDDELAEGMDGYAAAYDEWMDAAEKTFERTGDAASGEDVDPTEFRDIWLQSANEAFKHVMGTSAFAAANGQLVESMLELREQADEMSQETVAELGLATRDDVVEVGERLVELERRQHEIEDRLDRILEHLEG